MSFMLFFAPQLSLKNVGAAAEYYGKAFGAVELRRFTNDDGSVHVSELSIEGALFHLHEENLTKKDLSPEEAGGTTVIIGLFVNDPGAVAKKAEAAGGKIVNPVKDYEYGYRQATLVDPFGHKWLIEKKIP